MKMWIMWKVRRIKIIANLKNVVFVGKTENLAKKDVELCKVD